MSDDNDDDHGHDHPDHDYDLTRTTAPQQDYTLRDVGIGFAVLLVGALLTFGIAFAL